MPAVKNPKVSKDDAGLWSVLYFDVLVASYRVKKFLTWDEAVTMGNTISPYRDTLKNMSMYPWTWLDSSIARIVDGDSVVAHVARTTTIDIGFHGTTQNITSFEVKLRLNRINAPKGTTDAGKAATAATRAALEGVVVTIETVKPYKYGDEWMAEITLADGTNVSDLLVKAGHAVYWDGSGPRPSDG